MGKIIKVLGIIGWAFIGILGFAATIHYFESDETKAARKAESEAAAARRAAEETAAELACLNDLDCVVRKHRISAAVACEPQVERLAKTDFEWTAWGRFPRATWRQKPEIITFRGDEIKYQNGLGAWVRHSYECDYDIKNDAVINVRAKPGRL